MPYVSFDRSKTKSQIEQLTSTTDGKLYFAKDASDVVPGYSKSGGGLYVGTGGRATKIATTVVVEDTYTSPSSTNALSAKKGKELDSSVSAWTQTALTAGGIAINMVQDPNDSSSYVPNISYNTDTTKTLFVTCGGETLFLKVVG